MNGQPLNVTQTLLTALVTAGLLFLGTLITALIKWRTDSQTSQDVKTAKVEESSATVKVALFADRDTWEQRLINRVAALEDKIDKERAARFTAEELQQQNRLKIAELEDQVKKLQAEKVVALKDYQDRIIEQDNTIHALQDQLKELQQRYEEVMKRCDLLQSELDEERKMKRAEA